MKNQICLFRISLLMQLKWPIAKNLQIILFTVFILYFGRTLFIPLFFGLLIALILYPICNWLEKKGFNRGVAISICLLIVAVLLSALMLLFIWQINVFIKSSPVIISKAKVVLQQLQIQLVNAGIPINFQNSWIEKFGNGMGSNINIFIQTVFSMLFTFLIVPIYTALFLYHRNTFVHFLKMIIPVKYAQQLNNILQQTTITYFRYIKGMVVVYILVGILNSLGLWALGVEHPVLFGMICAIMTIIPYIGIIISALLPISAIWLQTGNIWYPIGVIAIFAFVQYLEANVIFPKVVGAQLNVSTLVVLIAIFLGGIIWGVAGMILFIPFVAILKIIADNIIEWKPLSLLLGR